MARGSTRSSHALAQPDGWAARRSCLVSSGASCGRHRPARALPARPRDLATQQAAASVGQLLLVERYAARHSPGHGLVVGPGPADAPTTCTAAATTPTRSGHWTGCWPWASSRSSMRTTPSRRRRSGSGTTTASRHSSPTWCTPMRSCCCRTSTACMTATPASPAPAFVPDRARPG